MVSSVDMGNTIRVINTETFKLRSFEVHGERYDYSKSVYVRNSINIIIICKVGGHGEFSQTPISHTRGRGCRVCGKIKTTMTVRDAKKVSISEIKSLILFKGSPKLLTDLTVSGTAGTVLLSFDCDLHGSFTRSVRQISHRSKNKICPKCSIQARGCVRRNQLDKISTVLYEIHGDRYSFPKLQGGYTTSHSLITAICDKHGEFKGKYNDHLTKRTGCPMCKGEDCSDRLSVVFEEWEQFCNLKYENKYDYSKVDWSTRREFKLIIGCPDHGYFSQNWKDHSHGCKVGCPRCASHASVGEDEVASFISEFHSGVERGWRGLLLSNMEADIYLAGKNIAIEFNGVLHHSSLRRENNYHEVKRKSFEAEGIRMIMIWEDEWKNNKEAIKGYLKSVIAKDNVKIHARDCKLKFVGMAEAQSFLSTNHLLGEGGKCSDYVGAYFNGDLVSLMAFKKGYSGWELHRMVNKLSVSVSGGFTRMLTYWRRLNPTTSLVSYVDLDKFTGAAYEIAGFKTTAENRTMWYLYKSKRESKFLFRKNKLVSLLKDYTAELTEKENCHRHGIYQVWNSGTRTLILDPLL